MAMADTPEAPARLAFGSAFSTTFATVFGHPWRFVKAALLPLAIGILLTAAGIALLAAETAQSFVGFLLEILGLLPLVILGIASCRLALIGSRAGAIPQPLFGRRTLVYLAYSALFSIASALPGIAFAIVVFGGSLVALQADPETIALQDSAMLGGGVLLLFLFYLAYLYFLLRFSLVFPAVAVDRRLGLLGSWRLTRGVSGFKLYALMIVVALLCLVAMVIITGLVNTVIAALWLTPVRMMQADGIDWGTIVLSTAPSAIIGLVVEFFGFLLVIVALATAYAQLSGWGAPKQDILERFE